MKKFIKLFRVIVFAIIFCIISSCRKDVVKEDIVSEPDTVFICVKNSTEFTFDDIEINMNPYGKHHYGVVRYGDTTKYLSFKLAHDKAAITFTVGTSSFGYTYGNPSDYKLFSPGKYTCKLLQIVSNTNEKQFKGNITRDLIQ